MSIERKIFNICNMYLRAIRNDDKSMMERMASRANDLYMEMAGTEYSMSLVRNSTIFNIAGKCTDYRLICDLESKIKVYRNAA